MLSVSAGLRSRGTARAGILSGLFGQSAFNAGPLSLSLPVIDTVEPVSSVILGAAVFGERLARSPGLLTFQLIGGAIAAAGIVVLSRSPVTLAEERRESQSASPRADQAPAPADRLAGNKHHRSFRKTLISRTYRGLQLQRRAVDERRGDARA